MKLRTHLPHRSCRNHRNDERGVVIILVAVFMLFVVGAMAALSIDVVTLYTARSEAQLAADGAALAGARVLANSGATSDPTDLMAGAQTIASAVATQVAQSSSVGGRNLAVGEITISFPVVGVQGDPLVTVHVQRTDLPTFFARIWGNTQTTVSASATAEAYNPSPVGGTTATTSWPVAPICVKPWLIPNVSPAAGGPIFSTTNGAVADSTLLGWSSTSPGGVPLTLACTGPNGACTPLPATASTAWTYFPGDDATTFPHPTSSLPTGCSPALATNYQESVAGCIQIPISCSSSTTQPANIDINSYPAPGRDSDTTDAVNCLTHVANGGGDTVTPSVPLTTPFEFVAGANNPVPGLAGKTVMVSDSLVTVPVFDNTGYSSATTSVPIIGFVQLFLNPDGNPTAPIGSVNTTVVNLVGCGTAAAGTPIVGNGASPVAVRLVTQ